MKTFIKFFIVFIFSVCLSFNLIDLAYHKITLHKTENCCEEHYPLVFIADSDTVCTRVCSYFRTTCVNNNKRYFCYYEHINDSTHVLQYVHIDSTDIKIINPFKYMNKRK